MRARNGFKANFDWTGTKLKQAVIISKTGGDCYVNLPSGLTVYYSNGKKVKVKSEWMNIVRFPTKKGMSYHIK